MLEWHIFNLGHSNAQLESKQVQMVSKEPVPTSYFRKEDK